MKVEIRSIGKVVGVYDSQTQEIDFREPSFRDYFQGLKRDGYLVRGVGHTLTTQYPNEQNMGDTLRQFLKDGFIIPSYPELVRENLSR